MVKPHRHQAFPGLAKTPILRSEKEPDSLYSPRRYKRDPLAPTTDEPASRAAAESAER